MKNTLIDTGPLIALFNKNDKHHKNIIEFLKAYKGILTTSWPVLTEVNHMLDYNINAQLDFLKWVDLGALKIEDVKPTDIKRIMSLLKKYSDTPMDLADASLIIISERLGLKEIITIDSDYYIYRTIKKEMIRNIFGHKD